MRSSDESDFKDNDLQEIWDMLMPSDSEDGEGARVMWYDKFAGIDARLTRLRELGGPDLPWQDTMESTRSDPDYEGTARIDVQQRME